MLAPLQSARQMPKRLIFPFPKVVGGSSVKPDILPCLNSKVSWVGQVAHTPSVLRVLLFLSSMLAFLLLPS